MNFFRAARARLRNAHPDHHSIATSMAWVALFAFLGKLAGAAKEMAIAYRYGLGEEVDAYLFVFNLINWPVSVWFSVLTVVLIPLAARIQQGAPADLSRFRSELLGLTLMLGSALGLISWFGLPAILNSSWTGLTPETRALASIMATPLALMAALGMLISLFSAWMLAAGRHTNTLLESVPALAILATLFAFSGGGTEPLVWGTLVGYGAHLASLALPMWRQGEIEAPQYTRTSPQWTPFWQGFTIMLAGQALMSITGLLDQFFAAHQGTGAIATLSYANRILALILGMGAMAVSRATLPVFSRAQAQGGVAVHHVAMRWTVLLFGLGVFAMLVSWWLAPLGVRMLFERGAFTREDTARVVEVLRYGLTQLPFYFAGIVLVSLLASQGRHRLIAAVASVNLVVKLLALVILTPLLGINGIALSTSLMYLFTLLLLGFGARVKQI